MTDWTRDMVEERVLEAAAVHRQPPGLRNQGCFSTWPEIRRSLKELAGVTSCHSRRRTRSLTCCAPGRPRGRW